MSDTPRTDANLHDTEPFSSPHPHSSGDWVPADFARQLERELADAKLSLQACQQTGDELAAMVATKNSEIAELRESLLVAATRFRDPRFGCQWEDAAEDCEKSASRGTSP